MRLPLLLSMVACHPDDRPPHGPLDTECELPVRPDWQPFCPDGSAMLPFVNPMVGTAGPGNTIPGALVPHGMARLSPDSLVEATDIDAYAYESDRIEGFSHTHLEGPGGGAMGYSQILVVPQVGSLQTDTRGAAQHFSHDTEVASPGYYAVTLTESGVRAELTASAHAGVHRYTFPASAAAQVLVDLGHSRGTSTDGDARWVSDTVLEGFGRYDAYPQLSFLEQSMPGVTSRQTIYFSAALSRAPDTHGTWTAVGSTGSDEVRGPEIGAWATFTTAEGDAIALAVGISYVSVDQARKNRELETAGGFDAVRAAAEDAWGCVLGRIVVQGGTDDARTLLYTSLYHAAIAPTNYTEPGGAFYEGITGEDAVHQACGGRGYYADDWCAWDTYRATQPLATLLEPETVDDRVESYLYQYQRGGWLPRCTWGATGYAQVMIANPAIPIVADAVHKGFTGFDPDVAWEAVHKAATEDDPTLEVPSFCGNFTRGTSAEYIDQGYVSHECDAAQSASMTLEYAFDDWATSQIAADLGRPDDAAAFLARSGSWRNHWDPTVGFVRGRNRDGSWVEPFDPVDSRDFVESNAWIFSFFVPQDVPGLIDAHGGDQAFVAKLDRFFDEGHFDPANEPSFHVPLLYNFAGRPDRTEERVRTLLDTRFSTGPGGLPGNDDAGATGAWAAFLSLGLFPVAPGDGQYELTTPRFDRVEIRLHPDLAEPGATSFVIDAPGAATHPYIVGATLDGAPLDGTSVTQDQIRAGGTLQLDVADAPGSWSAR